MEDRIEGVLAVVAAIIVLYTAMVNPKISLMVALGAIVCLFVYRKTKKVKRSK